MAAVAATLLTTAACSSKSNQTSDADLAAPVTVGAMAANFKDIELPAEMKWDTAESITVNTSSFQGGIAKYSGRVEINSLRDFLLSSMANNKWKMVGDTQYDNKIILAFTKPSRACLIALEEGFGGFLGKTYATLYVTSDLAAGTRTNPFGEPLR
ncbi:MAG TPA: hypothetical protein DEB25_07530 [Desulfobulbaceae bacterium]|nr:hypothetical protein [Desulfobulbaceae bacterium]